MIERIGRQWYCAVCSWVWLAALLLLVPVSAQAQARDEARTHAALASYLTAAFLDVSITSYCQGRGECREANPLLAPIVERQGVVAAMTVKGAMHAGITWTLLRQHRHHPRAVFWTTLGLLGAQLAVDAYNIRQTQGVR